MTRLVSTLATILLLSHTGNIFSGTLDDGNELLRNCNIAIASFDNNTLLKSDDYMPAGTCVGTIRGILGTNTIYRMVEGPNLFCPPEIANSQAIRVVVKYLKENPEILHKNGVSIAVTALMEAFPCK